VIERRRRPLPSELGVPIASTGWEILAMPEHRHFIPAAGWDWLLPLYDPLQAVLRGDSFRRAMLERVDVRPGSRLLDIGCGTGSFVVQVSKLHPEAHVTGLDPDPKALARARRKADRAGVSPKLEQGFSDALPFPDASVDLVFSSFMFHHLRPEEQQATLAEVRRVLRPGGSFQLVDFGRACERTNVSGRLRESGFSESREVGQRRGLFGRVAHYSAVA
jgi:ubiquinone/menaquinone biosynthesis C-methylase UbiE